MNAYTARVTELQSALHIDRVKDTLHGRFVGPEIPDDRNHSFVDGIQTARKRIRSIAANNAAVDENTIGAIDFDDAVSGYTRACVNAKHSHHVQETAASSSDSSMSKFP